MPIENIRSQLVESIKDKQAKCIIIDAPTGSGKSTQIPQFCLDENLSDSRIIVLQPRRLAARMLATRVAQERKQKLAQEVGYQIRFDKQWSDSTKIIYITEGLLLRWLQSNPSLEDIDTVILDEFHERHLDGDIALAILRKLQQGDRPDLKLIIMSATLPSNKLEKLLSPCVQLRSEGRTYTVEIRYSAPRIQAEQNRHRRQSQDSRKLEPIWETASRACKELLPECQGKHLLVFMPGSFEIRKTIETIEKASWSKGIDICPLYGELPPAKQDQAVAPSSKQKIIVATNVAETSITIDGVVGVIDSGLSRISSYDTRRSINTLSIKRISQASADQRAGRAGRTAKGTAIRLWSETSHQKRKPNETPEIHRVDLSESFLQILNTNNGDPSMLPWLEPPKNESAERAITLLESLGSYDCEKNSITDLGSKIAQFPLHPRWARMLIAASENEYPCIPTIALCAALSQRRGLFLKNRGGKTRIQDFSEPGDISDFQPLLRAFYWAEQNNFDGRACSTLGIKGITAREAKKESTLLLRIASEQGLTVGEADDPPNETLAKVILSSFSDQLATLPHPSSPVCLMANNRKGKLSQNSIIKGQPLIVATEIIEIEGRERQVLLNQATAIKSEWLEELFPTIYHNASDTYWDEQKRRVTQSIQKKFGTLILESKEEGEPNIEQAAQTLATKVFDETLVLKKWNHSAVQLINRINCLANWMPELEISSIDDKGKLELLSQICHGAFSYKDIKEREVIPTIKDWLSPPQQSALKAYTPNEVALDNGTKAKVTYSTSPKPEARISLILQRLYDTKKTPEIANNIPLTIEVLAPNLRPVQVTSDLESFWKNSYPNIKKELLGRYPKHEWR